MNRRSFLQSVIAVPLVAVGMPRVGYPSSARPLLPAELLVEFARPIDPQILKRMREFQELHQAYLRGRIANVGGWDWFQPSSVR